VHQNKKLRRKIKISQYKTIRVIVIDSIVEIESGHKFINGKNESIRKNLGLPKSLPKYIIE
jgi:bifunctional pyridoxal-dependent enzyme with beta-cystathionase and maltose regulon repressor activities